MQVDTFSEEENVMNCTGEDTRIRICRNYEVEVVGCYKLFDGRTVVSDAGGRIISDKYYLFKCTHRISGQEETIKCGASAAQHICQLIRADMPTEFNPFQEHHDGGVGGGAGGIHRRWHRSRRQLDNAIRLFITRYGDRLQPNSTIFTILARVNSDVQAPVEERDVLALNTILSAFHTNITTILNDFERTRAVRNFNFDTLEQILTARNVETNNYI